MSHPWSTLVGTLLWAFIPAVWGAEVPTCVDDLDPIRSPHPPYINLEMRSHAWGLAVVRFVVLPDGTTSEVTSDFSTSRVFVRSAEFYVQNTRFPVRKKTCSLSRAVELTLVDGRWRAALRQAPASSENKRFLEWISKKTRYSLALGSQGNHQLIENEAPFLDEYDPDAYPEKIEDARKLYIEPSPGLLRYERVELVRVNWAELLPVIEQSDEYQQATDRERPSPTKIARLRFSPAPGETLLLLVEDVSVRPYAGKHEVRRVSGTVYDQHEEVGSWSLVLDVVRNKLFGKIRTQRHYIHIAAAPNADHHIIAMRENAGFSIEQF
ncbi:MAG: hypothetical protein AAGH76_17390 [Pseudomonadota bacterium]